MGLLLNPEIGRGKLTDFVVKNYTKLSIGIYVLSLSWLFCLVYPEFNMGVHFSENSLLPGLANSEFEEATLVKNLYDNFNRELEYSSTNVPKAWLLAKFKQFNLDAFSHNFTLHYPFSKTKFTGENIYGVLRAPRTSETESIVISTPFRKKNSIYPSTIASVAYLLAFAKFASTRKYWAKNLIFLITEHEQLGMKAWLDAYHKMDHEDTYLKTGDLIERSGAIQAAINLELHNLFIDKIDVKIEGLNGRLPNMDLVSLVYRMCLKQNIHHSFKDYTLKNFKSPQKNYIYSLKNVLSFMASHATGTPDGNHGIFLGYGIDAVTLEGTSKRKSIVDKAIIDVGKMIESNLRSLNNLLERFHQSFFFYILINPNRFISIGVYIVSLIGLIIPFFLKILILWTELYKKGIQDQHESQKQKKEPSLTEQEIEDNLHQLNGFLFSHLDDVNFFQIGFILSLNHCIFGYYFYNLPDIINSYSILIPNISNNTFIFYGFLMSVLLTMFLAPLSSKISLKFENMVFFKIICLLEISLIILAVGILNISLGLFLGCIYTPTILFAISSFRKSKIDLIKKIICMAVNPIILIIIIISLYTKFTFQNESSIITLIERIQKACDQAFMLSVIDWKIYGNFIYPLITAIFIPTWINFWILNFQHN